MKVYVTIELDDMEGMNCNIHLFKTFNQAKAYMNTQLDYDIENVVGFDTEENQESVKEFIDNPKATATSLWGRDCYVMEYHIEEKEL